VSYVLVFSTSEKLTSHKSSVMREKKIRNSQLMAQKLLAGNRKIQPAK